MESFQNIYYDLSRFPGRLKVADSGMGWKGKNADEGLTLESGSINGAQWSRGARGYELKIQSRSQGVILLDGFQEEDFDRVAKCLKVLLGVTLENKEHALRGWNWGKAEFNRQELAFNVQNRPAFEIPYTEILNTNLAGKYEVALTLHLDGKGEGIGTDGKLGGTKAKGMKGGGALDQLAELRFYIPGTTTTTKKEKEGGEDGELESEDEITEEQNAASNFHDTLSKMADIGDVAGDTYAGFQDILHLTPRGRFDLDMYETSFRMRGKTYDYKIMYESIRKFMVLPKPDEIHTLICLGLDPPLRQGQTTYPFLVMQFKRDEEMELELNMTDEFIEEKFKDKLQRRYEAPLFSIVAQVFRGLAGKKVTSPAKDFESHHSAKGVKCSVKASEGILFCLEKAFMFIPKPAQFIQYDQVAVVVMSRVGGAVSASRTFDVTMEMKRGGDFQFSNINREEQKPLERFFEIKGIKIRNEMIDEGPSLLQKALNDGDLSSDEDVVEARADRGSADEDEESVDEDFRTESESDVAEEYDSAHDTSGSEGEEGGPQSDPEERPKKKTKTGK